MRPTAERTRIVSRNNRWRGRAFALVFLCTSLLPNPASASIETYDMPGHVLGLVYDGSYIWALNDFDDLLYKINREDGKIVGRFHAGGATPYYGTFDGEN